MRHVQVGVVYGHRLDAGGVETQLLSLMRRSRDRFGWRILSDASPKFAERARSLGAQLLPWSPRHVLDPSALHQLHELLRRHPVHLLHLHSLRATFYGRLAALRLGLPMVVTVHMPAGHAVGGSGAVRAVRHRLYSLAEKWLLRGFPGIVIHVSSRAYEESRGRGAIPGARTVVIENGVDLEDAADAGRAASLRAQLAAPADSVVLVCVARLDEQKGLDILIEAFARVGRESGLRAWLVGDGPLRSQLGALAASLGVSDRVAFLGTRDDVRALLAAADLFVLPSRHETTSFALLEAMAAGIAIVATDVGESGRVLAQGACGVVVPRDDPAALAAILATLAGDRGRREQLGAAAKARAPCYDASAMASRTLDVYRRVLGDAATL